MFVVKRPDLDNNRNDNQLWCLDLPNGEPRQLTSAGTANGEPAFSPDGSLLAFSSNRDDGSQVWMLPTAGGEARKLTDLPGGAARPVWFADGSKLLVISSVFADASEDEAVKERLEA